MDCYCQDRIVIGNKVVISQGTHLCAGSHDITDPNFQLITKPIFIEDYAWVAASAFVGPGVRISEGSVVGARAVIFRDTEEFGVYVGNPAQLVKKRNFRTPALRQEHLG